MTQEQLIKTLKGIRCWIPESCPAKQKIKELIQQLGGKV